MNARTPLVCCSVALALACGGKGDSQAESGDGDTGSGESGDGDGDGDAEGSGSGSESDSGESGEEDSGFIPMPDGGAIGTCDPALQDCPDGEKCTAYASVPGACCVDMNKCVPVIGTKQEFEDCERTEDNDDCDVGLFCLTKSSGSTGMGICKKFCDVNDASTCIDGLCVPWNDGINPTCEYYCDPLLQDCEGNNVGCYPAFDSFVCHTTGYDDGMGNDGDECWTIQSCKPSYACIAGDAQAGCTADRCCSLLCNIQDDPSPCPDAMEECVPWYEMGMAPPGLEDVGVCAIPA